MSASWKAAFAWLRTEFTNAARELHDLALVLTSFPDEVTYGNWFAEQQKLHRAWQRDAGSGLFLCGDKRAIKRFVKLSQSAGNALPTDYHVPIRPFRIRSRPHSDVDLPLMDWAEFLFITESGHFRMDPRLVTEGHGIARLEGNPFVTSALAVELILSESTPTADTFEQMYLSMCPWIPSGADGTIPNDPVGRELAVRATARRDLALRIASRRIPIKSLPPLTTIDVLLPLRMRIFRADCKIVLGTTPSYCPNADPPMPEEYLPEIEEAFRRLTGLVPQGYTIHWVGHKAWRKNSCRCFSRNGAETGRNGESVGSTGLACPRMKAISDFAWKQLAPLLCTNEARVRFAEQCSAFLRLREEYPDRPPPLPFDTDDEHDVRESDKPPLELCEKYSILAAVHEEHCHQEHSIGPTGSIPWAVLRSRAAELDENSLGRLELYFASVKGDLAMKPPPMLTKVVFAVHGIRTHADWQRAFGHVASNHAWRCSTDRWNYGYFSLIHFFLHFQRMAKVKWFRTTYHSETHDVDYKWSEGALPSIVAHSFGTYILGNALLKYDWLKFDKVILCGSILSCDFPWDRLIADGRVQAVRNEYGSKDIWTKLVGWFIHGAGPSGRVGFTLKTERLEQEEFDYDHSEYFEKGHMEAKWIPFLEKKLERLPHRPSRIRPPKAGLPIGFYAIYLAIAIMGVWSLISFNMPSRNVESGPQPRIVSPPVSGKAATHELELGVLRTRLFQIPQQVSTPITKAALDSEEAITEAVKEIIQKILEVYPAQEEVAKYTLTPILNADKTRGILDLKPNDDKVASYLWVFATDGLKKGHYSIENSPEQLGSVLKLGERDHYVHLDRPGYDLRPLVLPSVGQSEPVDLRKNADPRYRVYVQHDGSTLRKELARRISEEFEKTKLFRVLDDSEHARIQEIYNQSRDRGFPNLTRATLLRESRLDFEIAIRSMKGFN